MKLLTKNSRKILLLLILLFVVTGCTRTTDASGNILPEKIIYSETTFKDMLTNENWFTAFLVYPIAQVINFFSPKVGVVLSVIIAAVLVNLVILPFTIKSTASGQKMQELQPEMQRIQKKYEGRDDQASKLQQAQEMQALYNKYNVNPMASLFGVFFTLPPLIAILQAVNRSNAVLTGTFMGYDLQASLRDGFASGGRNMVIAIVIFLLLVATQYLSMSIPKWLATANTPDYKRTREDDSQRVTNLTMVVVVGLMSLSMPTAVSIYWIISSTINALKTLVIQKLVVEKE